MKTKEQKKEVIDRMAQLFGECAGVALSTYQGITMKELNELRETIRPLGGKFMIVKNTLAKIAAKGTAYEGLFENVTGPTAALFISGDDAPALLKQVFSYCKAHKAIELTNGVIDDSVLDGGGLKAFSELPSKDEVRSMFVGVLAAPMTQLVGVINGPARTLVGVLSAYEDKLGNAEAA